MTGFSKLTAASLLAVLASLAAHPASAATSASGVYVIIDPYNPSDYKTLQTAASTACPSHGGSAAPTTFCGAVSGVLLRTGWCNFEPDRATEPSSWQSCGYMLGFANSSAKTTVEMPLSPIAELTTGCGQTFDVCTGPFTGTLGNALNAIAAINRQRAAAGGLPPLKLSIGLESGMWTPRTVLNAVGHVDVPATQDASGAVANERCLRLPQSWSPAFVADYSNALDQLLAYTKASIPDADVEVVKLSPITAFDLEAQMPGSPLPVTAPAADPGGKLQNGWTPIKCTPAQPSATTWLNAYNTAPVPNETLAQAVESAFGAVAGHTLGSLAADGFHAQLSVPMVGTQAFADVDCGLSGSSPCSIAQSNGNWSLYYFTTAIDDLFNGGLAYRSAAAAFQQVLPAGTFSFTPNQMDVLWTGVTAQKLVASQQTPCILNNTNSAQDATMTIGGSKLPLQGAGTLVAWQTASNQGSLCSPKNHNSYMSVLDNGISQGADFMEVEEDAGITDVATCGSDLAQASAALIASLQTSCVF